MIPGEESFDVYICIQLIEDTDYSEEIKKDLRIGGDEYVIRYMYENISDSLTKKERSNLSIVTREYLTSVHRIDLLVDWITNNDLFDEKYFIGSLTIDSSFNVIEDDIDVERVSIS